MAEPYSDSRKKSVAFRKIVDAMSLSMRKGWPVLAVLVAGAFGYIGYHRATNPSNDISHSTPTSPAGITPEMFATPNFQIPPTTVPDMTNMGPQDTFVCESRQVTNSLGKTIIETRPVEGNVELLAVAICAQLKSHNIADPSECAAYLTPYDYVSPVVIEKDSIKYVQTIGSTAGNFVNVPFPVFQAARDRACGGVPQGNFHNNRQLVDRFGSKRTKFSGKPV